MIKSIKGFTIIEMLVVLGAIIVLVSLSVIAIQQAQKSTRASIANQNVVTLKTQLEAYYNEYKQYPLWLFYDAVNSDVFLCKPKGTCNVSTDTDVFTTVKIDQPGLSWMKSYFNDYTARNVSNESECNNEVVSGFVSANTWQIFYSEYDRDPLKLPSPLPRPQDYHLASCTEFGWKDFSEKPAPSS